MRKLFSIYLSLFTLLASLFCFGCKSEEPKAGVASAPKAVQPADKLTISLLEVSHGDAILLQYGDHNVMVDVGHKDYRSMLMERLDKRGIKKIDTVILTHHHRDHMGNIFPVAKKYKVNTILENGIVNPNYDKSQQLAEVLKKEEYNNRHLRAGDTVKFTEDYWLEVFAPGDFMKPKLINDMNNSSLVMKLHYKNFTMLLTGDIEKQTEGALVNKYGDKLKSDILKVAHHGSQNSSIFSFVTAVNPKYALISCGNRAKYGHPHKRTTGLLNHLKIPHYNTEDNGDLVVTTNGKSFEVKAER